MSSSKIDFSNESDALTPQPKNEPSSQLGSKPETLHNSKEPNEEEEKLQLDAANTVKLPSGVELDPTNPNSEPGYQVPVGTKDTNQLEDPPKTEETQPALLPYDIINCPPAAALDNSDFLTNM